MCGGRCTELGGSGLGLDQELRVDLTGGDWWVVDVGVCPGALGKGGCSPRRQGDPGEVRRMTPGRLLGWCFCFLSCMVSFRHFTGLPDILKVTVTPPPPPPRRQQWGSPSWFGLFGDTTSYLFDLTPNTAETSCQEGNVETNGGPGGPTDLICRRPPAGLQRTHGLAQVTGSGLFLLSRSRVPSPSPHPCSLITMSSE